MYKPKIKTFFKFSNLQKIFWSYCDINDINKLIPQFPECLIDYSKKVMELNYFPRVSIIYLHVVTKLSTLENNVTVDQLKSTKKSNVRKLTKIDAVIRTHANLYYWRTVSLEIAVNNAE
ncbi:hypothetical protein MXB_13 [Myxobolus squamalis]|nr:hypothetical protein MXB_13 [Myxobolus squamalis]